MASCIRFISKDKIVISNTSKHLGNAVFDAGNVSHSELA